MDHRKIVIPFPAEASDLTLFQSVQINSGAEATSYSMCTGGGGRFPRV